MNEFEAYYQIGLRHILDIHAYDHLLFIIVLCAIYQVDEIKNVLILVTAFTVGHSITLALAVLDIIKIDSALVEFLIPVTILLTALSNIFLKTHANQVSIRNYFIAAIFGLIHGLGFSNFLKSTLGKDESIVTQLFAFNIGLEVGQLIVVAIVLASSFLLINIFGVARRDWRLVISAAAGGIALVLILENNLI